MKLLIFGSKGKVGTSLTHAFREWDVTGLARPQLDITHWPQVTKVIEDCDPDVLINAAAMLGLDPCEEDPERALLINGLAVKHIAQTCQRLGKTFVQISTDAVFNGKKGEFYTESDRPLPVQVYGTSKLISEIFTASYCDTFYIFRLPFIFGVPEANRPQVIEKMLIRVTEEKVNTLEAADDVIMSPSYVPDLTDRIRELVEQKTAYGIYHLANSGSVIFSDFIKELLTLAGLDISVKPVPHTKFSRSARNHCAAPLISEKLAPLRSWKAALRDYVRDLRNYGVIT